MIALVMAMQSTREPHVFMPDGPTSQVLALAGDALLRRAGLPWPFADSLFASDGEHVGCVVAHGPARWFVEGLRLTGMTSWLFHPRDYMLIRTMAIHGGRLYVAGRRNRGCAVISAEIAALGAVAGDVPVTLFALPEPIDPSRLVVLDDDRLIVCAAAAIDNEHVIALIDAVPIGGTTPIVKAGSALPGERIRSIAVAGGDVVVHGYTRDADAVSFHARKSFACRFRVVRHATIPRWVANVVVDGVLHVFDDRPGIMTAPVDELARISAKDGAEAAGAALRSTWRESPFGSGAVVVQCEAVSGRRAALVVVERKGVREALVWRPDEQQPAPPAPTATPPTRPKSKWLDD